MALEGGGELDAEDGGGGGGEAKCIREGRVRRLFCIHELTHRICICVHFLFGWFIFDLKTVLPAFL